MVDSEIIGGGPNFKLGGPSGKKYWKKVLEIYWKSTFGFDFDHLPEIWTLFCVRLANFVQIEATTAKI